MSSALKILKSDLRNRIADFSWIYIKELYMLKQMCWLPVMGADGEKVLHLRTAPNQPWRPYNAFPEYAVPDYQIPGGSKGWATYQKLRSAGWDIVPNTPDFHQKSA
ncbi:hypothetical protein [Kamptonema formosum]|uniref:hypothetical protein n=1 Tax=Kamptonema formosum TaxID=331992 RepID=UPI000376A698